MKKKVQLFLFGKKQGKQKRSPRVTDFDSALTVGILFDCNNAVERDFLVKLAIKLTESKKSVWLLGYSSKPMKGQSGVEAGAVTPGFVFETCLKNDFGIRRIFKTRALRDFASSEFDILVDFSPSDFYLVKILVGLSNASLKCGFYNDLYENVFDVMIKQPADALPIQKFEHLTNYLRILNKG